MGLHEYLGGAVVPAETPQPQGNPWQGSHVPEGESPPDFVDCRAMASHQGNQNG
jgi:hypothetical protein